MNVKDLLSISSSGTFKSQELVWTLSPYAPILVFIYLSSQIGEAFDSIFLSHPS